MNNLLTIAVPFYKGTGYLQRTLESIFAQPAGNWTVLLVDNSISEAEREALLRIIAHYPSDLLRYVRNDTHVCACDNFNRCIDLAETDLVSTVHGDDEVLPSYAQHILGLADRHPCAAVLFVPASIIDEASQPRFSFVDWFKQFLVPRRSGDIVLADEPSLRSILVGNWINGAAVCYRKSVLGGLRWDAEYPLASDFELWSRVILSGRIMAGSTKPCAYLYRRHAAQTTALLNENLERFRDESRALDVIADRAEMHGWHSAAKVARSKVIVKLHIVFLMCRDLSTASFRRLFQKARLLGDVTRPRSGRDCSPERERTLS